MTDPHVEYLAHHWLLLAAPAFLPAVVVVGVVLYVALRDRRAGQRAEGGKSHQSDGSTGSNDQKRD